MRNKLISQCRAAAKNSKGFTLVELMVVIVVMVLVISMVYQFFDFNSRMLIRTDKLSDQQNVGRLIVQGLRKDFGTALTIGIVSTGNPDAFTVTSGTYTVYVKDGVLVRKDSSGNVNTIYSSYPVEYLAIQFSSTTSSVVNIAVTVQGTVIADTDVFTQNTTVQTDTSAGYAASGNLVLFQPAG